MTVWAFPPRDELIEILEWRTDVFRAKAGEQRIAIRKEPRRTFNLRHTLTDYQAAGARAVTRKYQGTNIIQVPDWAQSQVVGAVSAGSSVYVNANISSVDMGDIGLLWQSEDRYETVTINEDSNGVFLSTVTGTYESARLIPVWQSVCPEGLSVDRIGANLNDCQITFTSIENTDLAATTYAQYRGHDVIPSCPILGGLDETLAWPVSEFDNQQNAQYYIRQRTYPDYRFLMSWLEFQRADIYSLRQWIHSRKGRQKAFWLSSYAQDFEPAASVSGTNLVAYGHPGNDAIGHTSAFDIEVKTKAGASHYRRVISATGSTPIAGRDTFALTLDTTLTLDLADISRISFMRCSRFDADRIELSHRAKAGTSVKVPCVEIPVP